MVCVIVVRSERWKGEEDEIVIESFSIIYPLLRDLLS